MQNASQSRNGARKVITVCLSLKRGQELLVLFDETTGDVAHLLVEVANDLGVNGTALYVPTLAQQQLSEDSHLPLATESAIREAAGILTCLTDEQAYLPFRSKIFDAASDSRSRIGHMPGVTLQVLQFCDVDYQQVRADCQLLATALLMGQQLELITYDEREQPHLLTAGIGGWTRPPSISDGLIKLAAWANVPPGESFIAPIEGTARGKVVINGSLPGYVIPPGGELWLEFREGRLLSFRSDDPRCIEIIRELQAFAESRGDPNWCNLAEIGLGVNPAVQHLTGIELLDEKKLATAHIALGENSWFGGMVESVIHSDLVALRPTVRVDGQTIVDGGAIQTTLSDWQQDHTQLQPDPAWRSSFTHLSRSGTRGDRSSGMLKREWLSGRGNPHAIQVGRPESARKAAYLYSQIPPFDRTIRIDSLLAHNPDLDQHEVYQLIFLMQTYSLLTLT
jgi:leucyl aminopeptidase (aminopeptidase T)